jgi:hypothetical protein
MEMTRGRAITASAAIVIGGLLGTGGVTAAAASPSAGPALTGVAAPTQRVASPAITLANAQAGAHGVTGTPSPAANGDSSTRGVPIGPVVNWIKRNAPSIINGMKNALRSGLQSFRNWWNNTASWIRIGITTIANIGVSELYNALRHYFFG